MEELVKMLIEKGKTISVMESCTGGGLSNAITNIPDASKVIKFGAVTYSNDFKIKMGVSKELINEYTVYSKEVAFDMAKVICNYANSDYGVGITGKLKKIDLNNPFGEDDAVYLAIYDKNNNKNNNFSLCEKITLTKDTRCECKEEIINYFVDKMKEILK